MKAKRGGRQVVSVSLSPKTLYLLNLICQREEKSRSQVIRELIRRYFAEKRWQKIFFWGEETARKFKIKSEEDVLKLIND